MISAIQLTNRPNQTFNITIPGDARNLNLTIKLSYNIMAGYWVMGIYGGNTDDAIVLNIPLLCGYNLLGQFQYLNIGSACMVNIGDQSVEVPDYTNIGTNFILAWELI